MAESTSTVHVPVRSMSLPSSPIDPKVQKVEEELKKLQELESSPSTSSNIRCGLKQLVEIYDFVNQKVLCSPKSRQALRQNVKLVEAALDESIMLLDASDFARDLIGTLKDQIQDLQSSLRRLRGDSSSTKANVHAYVSLRKKSKKLIARKLKSLAKIQTSINNKSPFSKSSVVDEHLLTVSNILRLSNVSAVSAFRSLLTFLSSPVDQNPFGEVACIDTSAIVSLFVRMVRRDQDAKVMDVEMMMKSLTMLNMSLEAIEDELDSLARRLVQHRVCLLNILTP